MNAQAPIEAANRTVRVALSAGLHVILCVGNTLDQRQAHHAQTILDRQLIQGLAGLNADEFLSIVRAGIRTPQAKATSA